MHSTVARIYVLGIQHTRPACALHTHPLYFAIQGLGTEETLPFKKALWQKSKCLPEEFQGSRKHIVL